MKTVEVSGEGEAVIDRLISSGVCKDAGEVVRISLRLLDDTREEKLERLREDISAGVAAAKKGQVAPSNVEEAKKKYREQRTSS